MRVLDCTVLHTHVDDIAHSRGYYVSRRYGKRGSLAASHWDRRIALGLVHRDTISIRLYKPRKGHPLVLTFTMLYPCASAYLRRRVRRWAYRIPSNLLGTNRGHTSHSPPFRRELNSSRFVVKDETRRYGASIFSVIDL